MELKIGKYTNAMLAEWFGISEEGFKKSKTKKLEELKSYAEFYQDKGKVFITKVKEPIYYKKKSYTYESYKNNFNKVWKPGELNTCARASEQLSELLRLPITEGTSYNITRQVRSELYGRPFKEEGSLGYCTYQWCKKDENGFPVPFSKDELKIKDNLLKKYFGSADEKSAIVKGMILNGEIQPDEAWSVYEDLMGMTGEHFMSFLGEFQAAIGHVVVRATKIENRIEGAF